MPPDVVVFQTPLPEIRGPIVIRQKSDIPALAALLVVILGGFSVSCSGDTQKDPLDVEALEKTEDLSEALANDLHEMSSAVRTGDADHVADFLTATVTGSLVPTEGSVTEGLPAGVRERRWSVSDRTETMSGAEYLEVFRSILGGARRAEDVRFKVKHADFAEDGASGSAAIKFFVIRRAESGARDWIHGTADIEVQHAGEGPWQISAFHLHELETMTANIEWFSEVSDPAGLNAEFPRFGEGANEGFVSHGAAVADINNDGLLDIAATGVTENFLYLNDASGVFRDVSADSLVKFTPVGSGALFFDFDNDGDKDLFFAATGEQILLENRWVPEGKVRFVDISNKAGVGLPANGFSVVSADINADGLPDVYVCSYNRYGTIMPNSWVQATNGTPNLLFVNNGDGTFREEAEAWGVDDTRWSYAAQFFDIDEDGDQDLYVANDFGENALYVNNGSKFVESAEAAGLVDPGFGMGVSFGDFDKDGDFDLHVTNMSSTAGKRILSLLYPEDDEIRVSLEKQAEGNSLYRNQGDGTFENVSHEVGGLSGGWAFGGGFVDIDNDGCDDLHTPNGFVSGDSMKDT
jgi:hypothetical protein